MFIFNVKTKKGMKVNKTIWSGDTIKIGKDPSNNIVLQGWRVAKFHGEIHEVGGTVNLHSINDKNIMLINNAKLTSDYALKHNDEITIGDYIISISNESSKNAKQKCITTNNEIPNNINSQQPAHNIENTQKDTAIAPATDINTYKNMLPNEQDRLAMLALMQIWRAIIHAKLFEILDLRRINIAEMSDEELRAFTRKTIAEILQNMTDIPSQIDHQELSEQVLAEAVGLGPLEKLLERDDISEIMVNASNQIFYEQDGELKKSDITFTNDAAVISAIERIVTPLGRRIDESSPLVDARLKDGSRVNAVIPPLALKGPCITIRKFSKEKLTAQHLQNYGSVDERIVRFLEMAIVRKRNVVISGGTGSGKTTLLNVLSNFIPSNERIVTVEDAAELRLYQPNLVSLEARPANREGAGSVTIRDLVKNCLRMRPDRIVVGECRGGEALDMLQAMNTGHDGSLTTVHANNPRDCVARLEVLTMMSGMDLPLRAIRDQIASAVNIIVQQTRFSCGSRKITSVSEITGMEGEMVQIAEIFKFKQHGFDENGKVLGKFIATGIIPEFYEDLRQRGIEVDVSIFSEPTSEHMS